MHATIGEFGAHAAVAAGRAMALPQVISLAERVVSRLADPSAPLVPLTPAGDNLSARELDVLVLVVEGLTDKEIADRLQISRRTVSKHVQTILGKLDVPSRTAAATRATRHHLLP